MHVFVQKLFIHFYSTYSMFLLTVAVKSLPDRRAVLHPRDDMEPILSNLLPKHPEDLLESCRTVLKSRADR